MITPDTINRENIVPVIYVKTNFFTRVDGQFDLINWNGNVEFFIQSQDPVSPRNLQVWMLSD